MLYFVFLTRRCNLRCKYCGEAANPTDSISDDISYSFETLAKFISNDPEPIIAFYGGEPLLNLVTLERIMDRIGNARFIVQTNGLFLENVKPSYLNRFSTILVSIDGTEEITDLYRGKGTYKRIMRNVDNIRKNGYIGDLIARMTVSSMTNIYEDVTHLINLSNPSFNHIHWQLDVIWNEKSQYEDFTKWVRNRYNPGVTKLINEWLNTISVTHNVPGIVPFLGILNSLLSGSKTRIRCGAGIDAFAIQTDGTIFACPVCPEFDDFKVGTIFNSTPEKIKESLLIRSPCTICEVYSICGGRCLFTNHHNFWDDDFFLVCETIKHLISELRRIKPIIKQLLNKGDIKSEMFEYPRFNNTTEIIP
jgi:putative peptide-modifying radical SAM enzyme